ncbi:MAG: hypothetical protein M3401_12465 [Actinomycetota bacterium]|nr:hypothetical protein [Actinomycetota bacterium]
MEQPQAQRRLVKSPPELWAEVSSEESLGRHLAEFGEIRITRVEPETTVAWEGDRASGTVEISPTGWGTKVTLTATPVAGAPSREPEPRREDGEDGPEPQPVAYEAGPLTVEPEGVAVQPEPAAAEPEPIAVEPEPVTAQPERARGRGPLGKIMLRTSEPPAPVEPEPEPDDPPRGFFARFFRRHAVAPAPAPQPVQIKLPVPKVEIPAPGPPAPDPSPPVPAPDPGPPAPAPDPGPPAPGPVPGPQPVPDPVPPDPAPGPTPPPSIETPLEAPPVGAQAALDAPSEPAPLDPKRTVAILSEVLDDLGAAHHRPFSRG